MRMFLPVLFSLLLSACMNSPEIDNSEASRAKIHIEDNYSESQMAQKEYEILKKQRTTQ